MNKNGAETKVKKTLIRNYEQKSKGLKNVAIHDMGCSSNPCSENSKMYNQNDLNQPTLCSSEVLASYLSDVKLALPSPMTSEELNLDKGQMGAKITKKLNFHFNDKIYKNLIELNANVDEVKIKKDRKSNANVKRDLEPNIEDFCQDDREYDIIPAVPIIKPKFRPIRKIENGYLHNLIATFEDL